MPFRTLPAQFGDTVYILIRKANTLSVFSNSPHFLNGTSLGGSPLLDTANWTPLTVPNIV
jgi:hypothetical protein